MPAATASNDFFKGSIAFLTKSSRQSFLLTNKYEVKECEHHKITIIFKLLVLTMTRSLQDEMKPVRLRNLLLVPVL